jgi:hypothetical protein
MELLRPFPALLQDKGRGQLSPGPSLALPSLGVREAGQEEMQENCCCRKLAIRPRFKGAGGLRKLELEKECSVAATMRPHLIRVSSWSEA